MSTVEALQLKIEELQQIVKEQQELIDQLTGTPLGYATVVADHGKRLTIMSGGSLSEVDKPKFELKIGDSVLVNRMSGQIVEKAEPPSLGGLHVVQAVHNDHECEIQVMNEVKLVCYTPENTPAAGDRVLLDGAGSSVIRVIKQQERDRFDVTESTNICWDDIGGQAEAKQQMIEAVELPLTQAAVFAYYGKKPTKGILLYGPPGCGKTMLGKAAATSIAKSSGGKSSAAFMYVKGPELLDPYVGVTEMNIRALFRRARLYKEDTGVSAVIFVDEADAILGIRGSRNSFMEKTVVPSFLTEMDGMEASGALVILATNRPDTLDPAVIRDGRIDRKIKVSRPDRDDVEAIFALLLNKLPLAKGHDPLALAKHAANLLWDHKLAYYEVVMDDGKTHAFALRNLASGAMVAGIVEMAISAAMHRDITMNKGKPSGLTPEDIQRAVLAIYTQNEGIDHKDALIEFADTGVIKQAKKVRYEAKAG